MATTSPGNGPIDGHVVRMTRSTWPSAHGARVPHFQSAERSARAGLPRPRLPRPRRRRRMGRDAAFAAVDSVAQDAGVDVVRLSTKADEDELVSTENAQIATYALSLRVLDATRLASRARVVLGHSLGEYTALAAAGMVARGEGSRRVAARGAATRDAADSPPGGLVALLGGGVEEAEARLCGDRRPLPRQPQRAGPDRRGRRARHPRGTRRSAKEVGFRRAIPLKVGGAFHTPLISGRDGARAGPPLDVVPAGPRDRAGERGRGAARGPCRLAGAAPAPADRARPVRGVRSRLPEGAVVVEAGRVACSRG